MTSADDDVVIQELNTTVFPDIEAVQTNLGVVSQHLLSLGHQTIEPVLSVSGRQLYVDDEGGRWRAVRFVEGEIASAAAVSVEELTSISRFLGEFDAALRLLPLDSLATTIPRFHDFGYRLAQLTDAIAADRVGRVAGCAVAIDRVMRAVVLLTDQRDWSAWHELPVRLVHNDAKASNVIVDPETLNPRCVIDLDTCMPGTLLNDVGELVRSYGKATNPVDRHRLQAVIDGFIGGWGPDLADVELALMPLAGAKLTIENAVRFLADHLDGDRYFRLSGSESNLGRCIAEVAHGENLLSLLPG